ncbi:MAG: hypothetical protein PHP44_01205 [Kiritimatiellae bacterium]|nr:hypothetical protein [Kiritimatiellia bacterium]MDD4734702.1 hypothetical protein [Kiritimatiellia bacterium]
MSQELNTIRASFVELAGSATQSFGAGRVIGQIFAHLYLCREVQSLDDLTEALGISKGSASMSVRQLEQWGALKKVWKKGDRKDYYEATEDWGKFMRKAMLDSIAQHMERTEEVLRQTDVLLKQSDPQVCKEELKFVKKRIKRFTQFKERVQWVWDKVMLGMLMK